MSGLKTKELTIGGVSVVLASALPQQQMELYYLVYPYAERLYQEVDDVPKLTVDHLAKVLGFTGLETMQKIAALALSRTVKAGTSDTVTIADFENSIDSYHKLVAIAIEENLADFFTRAKRRKGRSSSRGREEGQAGRVTSQGDGEGSGVNWYLMRPTVGIDGVCPPMCTLKELRDGTYTLADVEMMNQTMSEALEQAIDAKEKAEQQARIEQRRMGR